MATTTTRNATRKASTRSRDAITVLKDDHREVERLFKAFDKASPRAHAKRRELVDRMIAALSQHAAIEEDHVYPWAREYIVDVDDTVLEAVEEHRVMKFVLSQLNSMDPNDERFAPTVSVLMESVRHHVEEEESELFRFMRDVGTRGELLELGATLEAARPTAPTTPGLEGLLPAVGAELGTKMDHARDIGKAAMDKVGALTGLE